MVNHMQEITDSFEFILREMRSQKASGVEKGPKFGAYSMRSDQLLKEEPPKDYDSLLDTTSVKDLKKLIS